MNKFTDYYCIKLIFKMSQQAFIGLVLICLLSGVLIAKEGHSQKLSEVKISLNCSNVSMITVFEKIENQTEFLFSYSEKIMGNKGNFRFMVQEESLEEVLKQIARESEVTFKRINGMILVKERKRKFEIPVIEEVLAKIIEGRVTDRETAEPIIGASVLVLGSTIGTVTDINGNYRLEAPENADKLIISYVGYESKVIVIGNQSVININLDPDIKNLNEVVVIGYGVQERGDITTAIASINGEDLKDQPVASFDQAIIGKLAGVQVIQKTGEPGIGTSIRVRGTGSITAGNDPLVVVDGFPLDNPSLAFENLNVNDIESIEVLKDASASAIYGSRGSNGVMIITTKKGKQGKLKVNYNGWMGFQEVSKKIDMLNAYDYALLAKDGHDNAYLDVVPDGSVNDPNEVRPIGWQQTPEDLFPYLEGQPGLTDTDWQDAIFRTAPIANHTLTLSGGSDNVKFYLSGFYIKQDGVVINSDYQKIGTRLNLNANLDRLELGLNFNPSFSINNRVQAYGPFGSEGVISSALQMPPVWSVYNPDGSYNYQGNGAWRIGVDTQHNGVVNPVAIANLIDNEYRKNTLLSNVFASFEIIENLKYKISFGTTINEGSTNYYRPSTLPLRGWQNLDSPSNPVAEASSTSQLNWILENTLSYQKDFGDHHFSAVAGYTIQKDHREYQWTQATNFPNDLVRTLSGGEVVDGTSTINEWSLISLLGRIQYDYKNRYLLSAAIRKDGSSRFGDNNKWGNFPSVSAGWRISEEDFLSGTDWLSNLKLRASYGKTGNFQIGNYEHIARLETSNYILGEGNGQSISGLQPSNVKNPDLGWEKTAMIDAGLDIGFLEDKLSLSLDWYNSKTSDLLLNVPVPLTTGFGTARQNLGEVQNRGWELGINAQTNIGQVNWQASFNISTNKNEVLSLGPEDTPIISTAGVGHNFFITQVGEAIGSNYLLVQDGVFLNENDLDQNPHFSGAFPGDFKFVDVDNDGEMDVNNDRAIVGNYFPDYIFGFNTGLNYKGVDFSLSLQGVQGNEIVNLMQRYINSMEGNFNNMTDALNRYRSEAEPGDGNTNRANRKGKGNNGRTSTWHLEDGSYVRLQNITIGYSLPSELLQKVKLSGFRIYLSGQNLFTWTNYSGYNPEVNNYDDNALTPGVDYGSYPLSRTYSVGANISF